LLEYPLNNIQNLEVDESEVFDDLNWLDVEAVQYGLRIKKGGDARAAYKKNFHILRERLDEILVGCHEVFTHNPWGEYGHEEHVQVFKAVESLKVEHKYNLWHSNYCSNKSIEFLTRLISDKNLEYFTLKTDKTISGMIEKIYKKNGCWTWYNDWKCFQEESFIKYDRTKKPVQYGHNFPLNMINVEIFQKQPIHKSFSDRIHKKIKRTIKLAGN